MQDSMVIHAFEFLLTTGIESVAFHSPRRKMWLVRLIRKVKLMTKTFYSISWMKMIIANVMIRPFRNSDDFRI